LGECGQDIIVARNSNKTLLSVVATWTSNDDDEIDTTEEGKGVNSDQGSEKDKEEGYFSDKGHNNYSVVLAREEK